MRSYSKECHGGSAFQCAIGDFVLISQILDGLNGRNHALDGEKSSQIGRVWRDDDEREKPPDAAHDARGSRLRFVSIKSCGKRVNLLTKRLLQSNEWTRKGTGSTVKLPPRKTMPWTIAVIIWPIPNWNFAPLSRDWSLQPPANQSQLCPGKNDRLLSESSTFL